jgi:hypothetical protein
VRRSPRLRPGGRGRLLATGALAAAALLLTAPAGSLSQEVSLRDLVVTGGLSSEGYQGNLPSVGVAVRDSTEFASAFVGEFGLRGEVLGAFSGGTQLSLDFDGGLRQFSARGFELRDYAPREWAGTVGLELAHRLGEGNVVTARIGAGGRDVQDRPPMPLFLQPGNRTLTVETGGHFVDWTDRRWDFSLGAEWADFLTPPFAPQIRLLDRRSGRLEVGMRPHLEEIPGDVRLHAGVEMASFPEQRTFVPEDPYRRDRAFRAGASWTWQGGFLAQLAGEMRVNRSNSRRPEYDSGTVRALLAASLPGEVAVTGYVALTAKAYRFPTEFARLIPGEEANSASQAYLSFTRGLAANLDGTFRMGWTRAETEIGGQYFQRYGASVLMNYRPGP